jgi:hypothetical protein
MPDEDDWTREDPVTDVDDADPEVRKARVIPGLPTSDG